MRFNELTEDSNGFYNPSNDQVSKKRIGDVTKPKLTLRNINNLKKLRNSKQIEREEKSEILQKVYGGGSDEGSDSLGF